MTDGGVHWSRVKEIFHTALDCAPEQRAALLRDACGEDVALAQEVESLLMAHAAAGSFGELMPGEESGERAETWMARQPALAAGSDLGPYRILGPLDAG